jgi:uncharacterized protein (TIGR00297 family)
MEPFHLPALIVATALATALACRAYYRKSLTLGGSIAAFMVGFLLMGCGWRGFNLFVFYFVAMKATKYKHSVKMKLDGGLTNPSSTSSSSSSSSSSTSSSSTPVTTTRGTGQVLACSVIATLLSVIHAMYHGIEQPINYTHSFHSSALTCGIISHHATCLADTLASELGILTTTSLPVLITQPWRTVPPGTNGGVTITGLVWSAVGGGIIGLSTILLDIVAGIHNNNNININLNHLLHYQIKVFLFGTICGLVGSILDSILGATVQQSYYDVENKLTYQKDDTNKPNSAKLISGINVLTNEQVNIVSVTMATVLGGWVIGPLFFQNDL